MTETNPRVQLLGYLLQALEPDETEQVADQLRRDTLLRYECLCLQRGLQLLSADEEPFDPPAQLAAATCQKVWTQESRPSPASAAVEVTPAGIDHSPNQISPLADDSAALDLTGQTLTPLGVAYHPTLGGAAPIPPTSRTIGTDLNTLTAGITDQVFQTNSQNSATAVDVAGHVPDFSTRNWRPLDVGVAVGAMLFLGALVLPSILQSREHAQLVNCQNNMREVHYGLSSLAAHHQGIFPVASERGPLAAAGVYATQLQDAGYLTHPRLVLCPESDLARQSEFRIPRTQDLLRASPADLRKLQEFMGGSYAFTLGYRDNGRYYPVKNQSRKHFALMSDLPRCTILNGKLQYLGHHGGNGRNVLFEDGHILYLLDCRESPEGDHFYLNHLGEPLAGTNNNDAVLVGSGQGP
ncbi:MAG: hypothetical protein SFX18_06740 [Pirellulales bacterium]|nr:hypothetical protein [Pirellulales bacterium]